MIRDIFIFYYAGRQKGDGDMNKNVISLIDSIQRLGMERDDVEHIYNFWRRCIEEYGFVSLYDLIDEINLIIPINQYKQNVGFRFYIWTTVPREEEFIKHIKGKAFHLALPAFNEEP